MAIQELSPQGSFGASIGKGLGTGLGAGLSQAIPQAFKQQADAGQLGSLFKPEYRQLADVISLIPPEKWGPVLEAIPPQAYAQPRGQQQMPQQGAMPGQQEGGLQGLMGQGEQMPQQQPQMPSPLELLQSQASGQPLGPQAFMPQQQDLQQFPQQQPQSPQMEEQETRQPQQQQQQVPPEEPGQREDVSPFGAKRKAQQALPPLKPVERKNLMDGTKNLGNLLDTVDKMLGLAESGDVSTGLITRGQLAISPKLTSKATQLFSEQAARFINLGSQDLKGRATNYKVKLLEREKPGLQYDMEVNQQILRDKREDIVNNLEQLAEDFPQLAPQVEKILKRSQESKYVWEGE